MTIKITQQNNQILVRRWKYSSEKKRSLPTTLYSVSEKNVQNELPANVVAEYGVDKTEQQTFIDFVVELNKGKEIDISKDAMLSLADDLQKAKMALLDPDLKTEMTYEQYQELSKSVDEIKKLVTKNKNALGRKLRKVKSKQ